MTVRSILLTGGPGVVDLGPLTCIEAGSSDVSSAGDAAETLIEPRDILMEMMSVIGPDAAAALDNQQRSILSLLLGRSGRWSTGVDACTFI